MNRRNFFKFLGRGVSALGVVAITGLPNADEVKEEVEWEFNLPKYDSDAEIVLPEFDGDAIYAGGQFTAMPSGLDFDGITTFNGTYWGSLDDWILGVQDD